MTLLDLEADTCKGCGHPLSEAASREGFEGYEASDPAACQGCKALMIKQRDYADSDYLPALRFGVTRIWKPTPHGDHHGH